MKVWIVALVLAASLGVAGADPKSDARTHVTAADLSYKLGDFAKALDEYTKAYQLFPVPALLFNIGQCHRELKHYEQALFFYEGFLRDSAKDAPNRDVVEALAAEMRTAVSKQSVDQAAAASAADAEAKRKAQEDEARRRADEDRAREEARQREERDRQVAEARRAEEQRAHDDAFYRKWWFWSAVGGAVAIGATAYYFSGSTTYIDPAGSVGGLNRK